MCQERFLTLDSARLLARGRRGDAIVLKGAAAVDTDWGRSAGTAAEAGVELSRLAATRAAAARQVLLLRG